MRNIIFIATACVLLSACGAYQPFRTQEAFHGHPVSPADEVKGKTVRSNTVVHRRLTNARSGATARKVNPNQQSKTVRRNTVVHRRLTNARFRGDCLEADPEPQRQDGSPQHGRTSQANQREVRGDCLEADPEPPRQDGSGSSSGSGGVSRPA